MEIICTRCGRLLPAVLRTSLFTGASWIQPPVHDAPCGLPCIGGGISLAAYRNQRAHGYGEMVNCPRCGALP